jgi:chromosome segregation ATPase
MYLQKLRLQELEDKNKRLEDENAACKRMLDECKRVLKTATMEIERLNYKLARKTEEASAERRSKEMAHKQLEELKTQRLMGSGSKLGGLVKPESTKNNPFAVKEDIGAIRKGLKPVVGEWPTVGSPPQQQDPTTLEFTCKARLSSAFAQSMPFITTVNGSPIHPSQGQQIPTQTQPQFTFGIYNSPPSSWS